jgi:hypothetical protein
MTIPISNAGSIIETGVVKGFKIGEELSEYLKTRKSMYLLSAVYRNKKAKSAVIVSHTKIAFFILQVLMI